MAGVAQELQEGPLDHEIGQVGGYELVHIDLRDQYRVRIGLWVRRVQPVFVLDEDHRLAPVDLRYEEAPGVGSAGRDDTFVGHRLPHVVGAHTGKDHRMGLGQ